jgi:2-polyprenyl-6-methoxyphenol hydroxylase-like FAD-dependent oxidoreductase
LRNKAVLISGAGIAGPTLAYWLAQAGFQPTLVEQAPALRRGGYVIDFWGLGYDIADRMGLAAEIERCGYHVREMRVVDEHGRRLAGFRADVLGALTGGRYVTVARSELSRLLFESVAGKVPVMFGDEIVGMEQHGEGVDVAFRHAAAARFDLVIGADGLHSNVRRLAFGPQSRFERPLGYVIAACEAAGYRPRDEDVYLMHNDPGRMVGRFALHGDRTLFLFIFAGDPADGHGRDATAQKAILHAKYGGAKWECGAILAALDAAPELYFDRVSQITMPAWSRGRVALVGDAAFCVSLAAGQGSALAMTAAYALAGELARAGGRHEEAFARYEALLRDFIAAKQRAAARFAAAFAPRTRCGLFWRNQVIRMMGIPGLAKLAPGGGIADRLALPDYW